MFCRTSFDSTVSPHETPSTGSVLKYVRPLVWPSSIDQGKQFLSLRNPEEFVFENSHSEAVVEVLRLNFSWNCPGLVMIVGFKQVLPSQLSITLHLHWLI
jgi:hypothetical protein